MVIPGTVTDLAGLALIVAALVLLKGKRAAAKRAG